MRMATKKPRKKAKSQEPVAPPEKKPTIPNEILKVFLDEHIKLEDVKKINKVVDGFLWERGGIQRYRINVWMKEPVEGMFCDRHWIGYSWFVQYNIENKTLTDKTIEPKPQEKKAF